MSSPPSPDLPPGFDPDRPAVVILHYGDPAKTGRLHEQLLASDPDWRANVMVLDNAAPEPYPAEATWLRLGENLYWAGALAFCVEYFAGKGASRLWFLNNDLYFTSRPPLLKTALARLKRMERRLGPIGLYSPAALSSPYHPQMVASEGLQASLVGVADGIAPLLSLAAVREVGGIDAADNPFGYGADLWLSLRLRRGGWGVVVDHRVTLRHVYHTTARTVPGFLGAAAERERDYLARRLGDDYRSVVEAAKADRTDFADI